MRINSEFIRLSSFYLFYFALVGVYIIFLPKMLSEVGYDATQIGALFSASPLMRFIMPFIFRRYGGLNSTTYLISLIAIPLSTLLMFIFLDNFYLLFAINLIYGASMGVILPFVDTYALKIIGKVRYGRVRLWGSIGFMLIALWLGSMLDSVEEAMVYLSAMAILTTLSGWSVGQRDSDSDISLNRATSSSSSSISLSRHWAFWIGTLLLQVSFGGFYNFFTIYETAHGISLQMTSWLWSFGVICEIVMLYFQGPLMRIDLLRLIEFTTFATAVRWMMLWLYPDSLVMAFISQSFHALSFALYYTAAIAYIYELYSDKRLAQQFFLGVSFGLGGAIGSLVAGWIYEGYPKELFLAESIIALLSFAMILIHSKRVDRAKYQ